MRCSSGILVVSVLGFAGVARADDAVTGEVVSARGRFVGGTIVTDVVLRTDDGRVVTARQLGGRADGYGQRVYPAPPVLAEGMRATVRVADGFIEAADVLDTGRLPFVRTGPTEGGSYLYWKNSCILLSYDAAGTADLAGDREFDVIDGVLATWTGAVDGCSYLDLVGEGPEEVDPAAAVGHDGKNRIVFRDERWCRPATGEMDEVCLPRGAAGLTTVTYVDDADSSRDGEIVDADVELNGEEFTISDNGETDGDPNGCFSDLANTLTHELGHVMGLDHTCLAAGDPPRVDGDGNDVPSCASTTDPEITTATMYNFQECGETSKASPEADDIDAICSVYPRSADPNRCEPVAVDGGGCCSTGSGDAGGAAGLALLTWWALAGARRRRRSA